MSHGSGDAIFVVDNTYVYDWLVLPGNSPYVPYSSPALRYCPHSHTELDASVTRLHMENYIVRVLRRHGSSQLDGVVEMVESGSRRVFHNSEELWEILNTQAELASEPEKSGLSEQE